MLSLEEASDCAAGLLDDDVELPPETGGALREQPGPVSPAHKRRRILRLRELEQQGSPTAKQVMTRKATTDVAAVGLLMCHSLQHSWAQVLFAEGRARSKHGASSCYSQPQKADVWCAQQSTAARERRAASE